jgi:CubicO group peptidase (beta-lactamase class C family)
VSDITAGQRRVETGIWQEPQTHPRAGLATTIEAAMARHRVPGCAVAVIVDGRLDWARGYGVTASAGEAAPVGADTLFQACSISKAVAATAAMRLVQDGRLDLDADVNDTLTSWQIPANDGWQPRVTLRQLLSHTAGLTYCWYPGHRPDAALPTTLETLLGRPPANTPPVRVTALPGLGFRYSGSHFTVLQQLLLDVTGKPFAALLRELVFDPLGMRDSGYELDLPALHPGATASGHDAGGAPIADGWRLLPESAGAGLWTTPADLCRLACAIGAAWSGAAPALLSQETARAMLTAQTGGWGLGWTTETINGALRVGHSGGNIGYRCLLRFWPELGLGAAVMTNADDGTYLVNEIFAAIGREYGWPDAPGAVVAPSPSSDPSALAACAGIWADDGALRIVTTVMGDRLMLHLGGQSPVPLLAVGASSFIAEVANAELRFECADDGAAEMLILRQAGQETRLCRTDHDTGRTIA